MPVPVPLLLCSSSNKLFHIQILSGFSASLHLLPCKFQFVFPGLHANYGMLCVREQYQAVLNVYFFVHASVRN